MCKVLKVHRSGFYAWFQKPLSDRAKEDQRLTHEIRESWCGSGFVYGSPRIHQDLREVGESCSVHRVARLMRLAKIEAQRGYKRHYAKSGVPSHVAPNQLKQDFTADRPDAIWVTDITYSVPGAQGKHGCLNEPRVYLKYIDMAA